MYHMAGHRTIDALVDVLREKDAEDEYLTAREKAIISRAADAGYLGYCVNLENFRHPIGVNFFYTPS